MSDDTTIFDQIIRKEIPCDIVFEDEHVLAFRDINPQAPVHVLVIPKQKFSGFHDLNGADPVQIGTFIERIAKVASFLNLDQNGYRIVFNQGEHGGQTVSYIHAHILGGCSLTWPPG